MKHGLEPAQMGVFQVERPEFLFVQYLPIKMAGHDEIRLPENLACFTQMAHHICTSLDDYLYLTAKHTFVPAGSVGNRPGWHCDGFGTRDTNWLWSDALPTEFCVQPFDLSHDDALSMQQMKEQAQDCNIVTHPVGTLLAMDASVVHRPAISAEDGYRLFAKFSVSKNRYQLAGNAHNYLFDYDWPMTPRALRRNSP